MGYVGYTELRRNLAEHLDRVESDRAELVVSRRNREDLAIIPLAELESLRETLHLLGTPANAARLKTMLVGYAAKISVPLHYDGERNPYFFADANGDGVADQADGKPVPYSAWTPRLLKAAYNWKFVSSDAGVHVHNPHYALELLYDSMEDLAAPLGIDFAELKLVR